MADWHLYLIRTSRGALYTGITTDIERRLEEHRRGGRQGARYLRANAPQALAYSVCVGDDRALAARLEAAVKKLPKTVKESIVADAPSATGLLSRLGMVTDNS